MGGRFRYSRWDGSQHLDDLDADAVLESLSEDLMSYGDLSAALQRLYRWGSDRVPGLEQLLKQIREQRERELSRYDLDSTVEKLREQLDEVVQTERRGIDRKLQEQQDESARRVLERMAKQRKDQLDRIPDDLGSRVKALRNYEFMDPDAEQMFNDLLQKLQQQIMDQMFQGMKQGIQSMTQQDVGRVREMVRDLNKMLEQRERGQQPDFQGFMQKYGDMFPPGIETLDQLLEHLQRQMAQMQSLLQSLSPEARDELRRLMDELLQDDALRLELARLAGNMQSLMPPGELTERYPFFGDDPLSLQQAMGLMERLQQMDRLESQLERGSFRLDDVDRSLAEQVLGPEARQSLDQLRQMTEVLEKAGYVERRDRRLELTPRGLRRIGQSALRDIFEQVKKVAIALDALIRSQFPRDSLYVVGFSNHAVELKPQSLPQIALNDYVYGTNMQHGFQLARSLLAKHRGNRQIIMVTDGEPTAHLDNGRVYFAYPPTFRPIQETLKEVRRRTRDRIVINTFMLERGPYLTEFINQMTRINKGRAFFVSPERLGESILVDYVSGKARRQRSKVS